MRRDRLDPDLLKVWHNFSDLYYFPGTLGLLDHQPYFLYSMIARDYEVYDVLKNSELGKAWNRFCEKRLLELHNLDPEASLAITRLSKTESGPHLCRVLLSVHEEFMASLLGKELTLFFPLESEDERFIFSAKIREGIDNHSFALDQIAIRTFPQFGRVECFARVYDSPLNPACEVEAAMLRETTDFLSGRIAPWPEPELGNFGA